MAAKRRWAAATVPSMPTARVNGITMYYEQHGAGELLLLINGLGADITLLAPIIAWFERSFRVVAFDNRGAGRTDKPDAPYTIELMAQDTAALMDVLSQERADVLGVSMGGRIALELALSCPDRVGRLVLVSTSAAGRGKVTVSWPMRLLLPLRWAGLLRGKYPQPRYAYLRQRQASASYDATDRLGDIRVPALILHAGGIGPCRWTWPNGCMRASPARGSSSSAAATCSSCSPSASSSSTRQAVSLPGNHATGRNPADRATSGTRQMRMVNSTTAMHKHSGPAERALDLHQGTPRAVSDADPRW